MTAPSSPSRSVPLPVPSQEPGAEKIEDLVDWLLDHDSGTGPAVRFMRGAILAAYQRGQSAPSEIGTPQGESLWLIETSRLAQPNGPQRHFYTGDPRSQWHYDALKAARYPSKEAAEHVAEKAEFYPRDAYPVCEHLFQCGVSAIEPPPGYRTGRRKLFYNKITKQIEVLDAASGFVIESFDPPEESNGF